MTDFDMRDKPQLDYDTFYKFIECIPSCIFFKDTELRYQFSSHFWTELVSKDIIGKTDLEVRKDTENAIKAMEQDRKIIETKQGCKYVIKSEVDGVVKYLELIKEPVFDDHNEVIGIVGLINNVTEKTLMEQEMVRMSQQLEQQCEELEAANSELSASLEKVERMNKAQKMFTASMNHELRSPLNGIIGNLQLLMHDPELNAEQQKSVNNIFLSSQLMLGIVNELLDFAKMEMSGLKIRSERFSLSTILDNIEYSSTIQAKDKGLQFALVRMDNLPDEYIGDGARITQILHNFVTNAIKYTDKGNIILSVAYQANRLIINCTDTGQGIPEEAMKNLYDPFVRFNEKENAHIQGTGLGLSVVKKIVDSMNGEISVESKIGVGSTFIVKLPIGLAEVAQNQGATANQGQEAAKTMDFSSLQVLCVDDSKMNAKILVSLLGQLGVEAEAAYSGMEGIEKADGKKYDLIFMDHMMPEMDGIETFHRIRKQSVLNADTPVVMLSGNADEHFEEFYKEQGLDGSIAKPVMIGQLKEMMIRIVK